MLGVCANGVSAVGMSDVPRVPDCHVLDRAQRIADRLRNGLAIRKRMGIVEDAETGVKFSWADVTVVAINFEIEIVHAAQARGHQEHGGSNAIGFLKNLLNALCNEQLIVPAQAMKIWNAEAKLFTFPKREHLEGSRRLEGVGWQNVCNGDDVLDQVSKEVFQRRRGVHDGLSTKDSVGDVDRMQKQKRLPSLARAGGDGRRFS